MSQDSRHLQREIERDFTEVLQELRVVQTGVQILSAFLLTLPFTVRFDQLSSGQLVVYGTSVVAATICTALVIAPVAYRNSLANDTPALVRTARRLAQTGMVALLVAVVASVSLALDVAVGPFWAVSLTGTITLTYLGLWYVLPAWHRHRNPPGGSAND